MRVNWGGGWTDTPPYCLEHGGTVLNAAISLKGELPVKVSVRLLDEPVIRLESRDIKMVREFRDLSELVRCDNLADPLSIHKAALQVCGILPEAGNTPKRVDVLGVSGKGFLLSTSVNVPKGSGLGTSSILAGALVKALTIAMDLPVDDARLFDQVLCMEQLMTTGGGWQDQVGGLVPGVKMITSRPGLQQKVKVENVSIPEDARQELEERFVLVFTGQRRLARNILREVVGKYMLNSQASLQILDRMQEVAALMRFEQERGNIDRFAHLLNEHWKLSCSLDAGTTNTCINQIIDVCSPLVDGVFIAGAGGGGFMQMILSRGASRAALKERLMSVFQDINIEVWETGFVWVRWEGVFNIRTYAVDVNDTKHEFTPIAAIAICRLPEDVEDRTTLSKAADRKSLFRGIHLLISNRHDDPMGATAAYVKRWRIEVFYRAAKQDLGLTACRAETEQTITLEV